jgi:WD40 repeat protein
MTVPAATAVRQACADLDRRVRAGEDARAEEYFRANPALAETADAALEMIYAEFVARAARGDAPPVAEWLTRFPRWADELRELFQVHELMSDAAAPVADDASPRRLRHFDLLDEVGRGSSATVYRALDRRLGRVVAVKVLRPTAAARPDAATLGREGGAVARLQHPNIVPVYEIGEADGCPFLALEFVHGGTLADRIAARPFTAREAAALLETVARAVHYAHLMGVVHRDLKPANVLLTADGVPKITDFGLACIEADAGGHVVVGTPGYMAPEQRRGAAAGPAADVYALGAILRELLAGRANRDLAAVAAKCLRESPADRYPDAAAVADDLRRFAAGEPVSARAVGPLERAWKFARRRPAVAALVAVVAAGGAGGLAAGVEYNARLRAAVDRAEDQARLYREQLDATRRHAYAVQLAHADAVVRLDPARGRALLDDPAACPPEFREFAWRYLRRLCDREQRVIPAGGPAYAVAAGRGAVAAVTRDAAGDAVTVWDTTTGGQRCRLGPAGRVTGLALSPDGRALAVAREPLSGGAATVTVHDAMSGDETAPGLPVGGPVLALGWSADGPVAVARAGGDAVLHRPRRAAVRLPTPNGLRAAALAPDGDAVAAWAEGMVTVWDADGRPRAELRAEGTVDAAAFAPGGDALATVSGRGAVVWDVAAGRARCTLAGHTNAVVAVAFSPDGMTVATAGEDFAVRLWDADRGAALATLRGHEHIVTAVAFAPDRRAFATGSSDGTVRVWDAEPERRAVLPHAPTGKVLAAAVSPDGATLATAATDGTVALWECATGRRVATLAAHPRLAWAVAFAPDGRTLATAAPDQSLKVWEVESGRLLREFGAPAGSPGDQGPNPLAVAFLPGGARLVTAHQDGRLRVWDTADGRLVHEVLAHPGGALCLAVAPGCDRLATGGADHTIRLWDTTTWQPLGTQRGHRGWVVSLAFDPTGRVLASGSKDQTVKLWTDPGRDPRTLLGHTHWPYSLAFAPDGRTLAAGTADRMSNVPGEVKLWDPTTGRALLTLPGQGGPVGFAAGGATLLTADLTGRAFLSRP